MKKEKMSIWFAFAIVFFLGAATGSAVIALTEEVVSPMTQTIMAAFGLLPICLLAAFILITWE